MRTPPLKKLFLTGMFIYYTINALKYVLCFQKSYLSGFYTKGSKCECTHQLKNIIQTLMHASTAFHWHQMTFSQKK